MSDIVQLNRYNVRVTATVTEGITGISANDTQLSSLYETPEKLTFSSTMPYNFKPGLPYNIIVSACPLII